MYAYNIAGDVSHGSLCILFNARSVELHTLHAPEQVLELAGVSDLRVGGGTWLCHYIN